MDEESTFLELIRELVGWQNAIEPPLTTTIGILKMIRDGEEPKAFDLDGCISELEKINSKFDEFIDRQSSILEGISEEMLTVKNIVEKWGH